MLSKRKIRQNWRLLKALKCSACEYNDDPKANKPKCDKHCVLLLLQTKYIELEHDKES